MQEQAMEAGYESMAGSGRALEAVSGRLGSLARSRTGGAKALLKEMLAEAGVELNGGRPGDLMVRDERFYDRLLAEGSVAMGDSYIEGWWEAEPLDELIFKMLRQGVDRKVTFWRLAFHSLKARLFNLQRRARAFNIAEKHYNLGNDLYAKMLDSRMIYSCGYWKYASSLEEAQVDKLELICQKLRLKPGMTLLDIGCGWGGLLKFAAENHGVRGLGVTVSKEQAQWAREACRNLPVEIRLQDYRDLEGRFDRVVSVGMFEHVGPRNYAEFMDKVADCLDDDGLCLLHTIGGNLSQVRIDPWIDKHIFPDAVLPSICQVGRAAEDRLVMEDWHNFGPDYDRTLMAWHDNFERNWPSLEEKYGPDFYRMWKFYLLSCAGSFRSRVIQLWQIVLSRRGRVGGYESVR